MGSGGAKRRSRPPVVILLLIVIAIILVAIMDWGYAANGALGLLFALPIAMTATLERERWVWLAVALASVAMIAVLVVGPPLDMQVDRESFTLNRALVFMVIAFSAAVAIVLQRRRLEAERARDAAVSAGNLNRILVALIAHDLRAPLVLADQALTYSYESAIHDRKSDPELLADVSARVGRSLRMIEGILSVARHDVNNPASARSRMRGTSSRVKAELTDELAGFGREAEDRGKVLDIQLDALGDGQHPIDGLLVRQVAGILVDNAIRYAPAGRIRVSGRLHEGDLILVVADGGMVPSTEDSMEPGGAGLGLELCRAIAANAGGSLTINQEPNGRNCTLRLPLGVSPASAPLVPVVKPVRV